MRGFATKPTGEPVQNPSWMNLPQAKAPGWGMNGPGVSAEWSQGGESEWNSAAASACGSFCAPLEWMNPPCPVIRTSSPVASVSASVSLALSLCGRSLLLPMSRFQLSMSASVGAQIVNLLQQLQRDFGLTYLFISHSMPVVRYLSTRIAVMYQGKIVEVGTTEQITAEPQHTYTRKLLAATPEMAVS